MTNCMVKARYNLSGGGGGGGGAIAPLCRNVMTLH